MPDEALELLREVRDLIAALPAAIAAAVNHERAQRRLSAADEEALGTLLPALARAVGSRTFCVHELLEYAALEIEPAIALRAALESVGGRPHKLGRLLRRGADADVGGYRIVENGSSRDGMLRSVVTVRRKTHSDE